MSVTSEVISMANSVGAENSRDIKKLSNDFLAQMEIIYDVKPEKQ